MCAFSLLSIFFSDFFYVNLGHSILSSDIVEFSFLHYNLPGAGMKVLVTFFYANICHISCTYLGQLYKIYHCSVFTAYRNPFALNSTL